MVLERGLVVGGHRGCAVIVHGPRGALASQLNAGVRLTRNGAGGRMRAGRRVQTGETRWANGSTARPVSPRQAGQLRPALPALLDEAPESLGFAPRKGVEPTEDSGRKASAPLSRERPNEPTESLRPMWQLTSIACRLPRPGCSRFGNAASWWVTEAGEQGDEADEALGGAAARTARNVAWRQVPPRARAASMDAGTASQLIASVRLTTVMHPRGNGEAVRREGQGTPRVSNEASRRRKPTGVPSPASSTGS